MWFLAGRGRQRIDQRSIEITPQMLCVIPQGCVHQFEEACDLAGFVVAWTDDLLQSEHDYPRELLQAARETLAVPAAEQAEFTAISQLISAEYARAPLLGQSALLRHWVCALLIRVERLRSADALLQPPASSSAASVCQDFARLLHAHYRAHHDVGFYADRLGLSANRLSRVLQQIGGKTAKDLIQQQLVGTGVRVTLIAPGVVETPFWPATPSGPMLQPEDVARAVLYAVGQPAHVDVNEVLLRPAGQQI